jgi:isopenicillin-N N-acyltransferase like protein
MRLFLVSLVLGVAAVGSRAQSDQCTGTPNNLPVYTGDPEFVNKTTSGSKWLLGSELQSPKVIVLHVYGTPYEMGYAYGELLKGEITEMVPELMEWFGA